MHVSHSSWLVLGSCAVMVLSMISKNARGQDTASPIGVFESHGDYGTVLHPGNAVFDEATKAYTVTGSGLNLWAKEDAFQFVWRKVDTDCSIAADIEFGAATGTPEEHRKACVMIRQSLDKGSAYADVARHGNGLTSLQFRAAQDDTTHEIQTFNDGAKRIRLEKRGDYFYMYVVPADGSAEQFAGGSAIIKMQAPFYVGLAVCAHNKDLIATAKFSNVEFKTFAGAPTTQTFTARTPVYCCLETITVASSDRRVTAVFPPSQHMEAPNWWRNNDAEYLIYNSGGKLFRIKPNVAFGNTVAKSEPIDSGNIAGINNDHVISFDGKMLGISASPGRGQPSAVFTLPVEGGAPTRITMGSEASYFHGWSPDGKTLAFCGQRKGLFDVYTIPATGGAETQLTHTTNPLWKEDGPEYSPDGQYIYFNSQRTGTMQIWRMKPDGSEQEQLTNDEYENWFAHVAPPTAPRAARGGVVGATAQPNAAERISRQIVFISYEKGAGDHPANKDVQLRLMDLATKQITVLTKLFGGQGTMNVPSWSPDGTHLAFVSYHALP